VPRGFEPCRPAKHGRRWQQGQPVYAALDLGTNNCRLLIAVASEDRGHEGFRVIDAFSRIVRLGEGLSARRYLSEVAIVRTLAALKVCADKIRRRRVSHLRAVATEACRKALNCDAFLDRVEDETGIRLEIISGKDEAHLSISGCAPLVDPSIPHALVFDIGGGSTEVSWLCMEGDPVPSNPNGAFNGWPAKKGFMSLLDSHSLPLGVVTLAEKYGGKDIPAETYRRMVEDVRRSLLPFAQRLNLGAPLRRGEVQMLGTSGTVTTLAGIKLDLPHYDRRVVDGLYLDRQAIADAIGTITAMDYRARLEHPCIGTGRADLVIAGCAVLEALRGVWPVPGLRVADRGLREGILTLLIRQNAALAGRPHARRSRSR